MKTPRRTHHVQQLIDRLRAASVQLRVDGGQLRYEAPAGVMSGALLADVRRHKDDLIVFLQEAASPDAPSSTIAPVPRTEAMPLSVTQQRLWFLYHLDNRGFTYNVPKAIRLRGPLHHAALERAFAAVIARHESLRTSFESRQGQPVQRVHDQVDFALHRHDLTPVPDSGRLAAARQLASQIARTPFDLAAAPLLRAHHLTLADDDHVLVVVLHHIVSDGRSLEVLFSELATAYAAARENREPHWTPLPVQYVDYAAFEADWLTRPGMSSRVDWWRTRLADAPALLQLPPDRPRPPLQSFDGATELFTLPAPLVADMRTLARQHGASLYMTVIAAAAALLSTLSGQDDICIGCPTENRPFPETADLIGAFINTLVMRVRVDRRRDFAALLEHVRETALEAYERQDVPFERIVDAVQPERNLSASPLFQVAISWLDGRRGFLHLADTTSEAFEFELGRVKFDLNLECYETDDELHVAWFYSTALFDAQTIRRWASYLERLLGDAVRQPATPLVDLDVRPPEERRQVEQWNRTQSEYPRSRTIVDLIEEQAARTPNAEAVFCNGRRVSYAELEAMAHGIASLLRAGGSTRGSIVALLLDRSIEAVAAILGVLKCGAAYLPLDLSAPADRLAFMLADSGATSVLVSPGTRALVPPRDDLAVITVTGVPPAHAPARDALTGRDVAYVMYTSGSTGTPKAVVMEHGGLLNYLWWARQTYTGGEPTSFPLFTPLSFDLTVTSLYLPLLTGGRIVAYPEDRRRPAVFQVVRDKAVDIVKLTPAHLAMIADMPLRDSGIRALIVGGEDFKTELARRIDDAFEGAVTIYNEYGPTETAVGCMLHRFDRRHDVGTSVPIGRAAGNVRLHILDRLGRPVPLGAAGELHVGGDGVARGYLGRPSLTAERFLPDPSAEGDRMYRTGDLARVRTDGVFEYLGRVDRQVKIRGHRIELDEIAAALNTHESISDCIVELVSRERVAATAADAVSSCVRCGLSSSYPGVTFDEQGICDACLAYEQHRERLAAYFRTPDDFRAVLADARVKRHGQYDCLALVSGGKDSIYMVSRLKELGASVLAYTFDPGYLSEQAKANIRHVTGQLGVDHLFGSTPHMKEIFADSLARFANVCNGCFKTLYTLSVAAARERGIPMIVTGLSRGQLFETRLSKYYNNPHFDADRLDAAVVAARKVYHRLDDVIARRLDVSMFSDDRIFDEVQFVDFYRYFDVSLRDMLAHLAAIGWKRPADTGRSTNCLINDVGIYVHRKRRGYHNYALPYSWDVRMGHKTREEAVDELNDEIDEERVRRILADIGAPDVVERTTLAEPCLVAYVASSAPVPESVLREHLARRLPAAMIPEIFVTLDALPVTANGKIDRRALPAPRTTVRPGQRDCVPPRTDLEREIAAVWSRALGFDGIGVHDDFFALGGHSLMATQIAAALAEQLAIDVPLAVLFERPTIAALAEAIEPLRAQQASTLDDLLAELELMSDDDARERLRP